MIAVNNIDFIIYTVCAPERDREGWRAICGMSTLVHDHRRQTRVTCEGRELGKVESKKNKGGRGKKELLIFGSVKHVSPLVQSLLFEA